MGGIDVSPDTGHNTSGVRQARPPAGPGPRTRLGSATRLRFSRARAAIALAAPSCFSGHPCPWSRSRRTLHQKTRPRPGSRPPRKSPRQPQHRAPGIVEAAHPPSLAPRISSSASGWPWPVLPLLVKSSIDIETKAWTWATLFGFIPTVTSTRPLFPPASPHDKQGPLHRDLLHREWNPVLTFFEIQARKDMINIAVLNHMQVISEGLKRLGRRLPAAGHA